MSDDEDSGFRINESYAKNYNTWRQKEELQKLKDKYGDVDGNEDMSSSSEEEDEDAEELTPQLEKDWLKTLSALKSKDPRIYDKNVKFYHSEGVASSAEKKDKKSKEPKPMFLKDYERKVILEKGGQLSDESSDGEGAYSAPVSAGPSYFEEQEEIKKSIQDAVGDEDSDSDSDILVKRTKTKEEEAKEEEDYLEWLKSQPKEDEEKAGIEELVPLRDYWSDPNLQAGEKFLRDYILNKRYLEDDDERIPTYDEIVEEGFSDEEAQLEKEEAFERKYNFRFEQPDEDFIKRFPRTIDDSVRRKESKRAVKRQEIQERKDQEKAKKREEIAQLKRLKKKEIQSKLDRIREITGNTKIKLTTNDLEEDFDPDKYDQAMKNAFNDDYYEGEDDGVKPVFSDDEELGLGDGRWSQWQGGDYDWSQEQPHCEDPDFNMDADYMPQQEPKKKKKKGKKNKNEEDEDDAEFEELYKLDYEDIIGDLPCRFQYREVIPNDYGLDTEEILFCPDRELNAWASLKKSIQYRTEEEEHWDVRAYRKRGANIRKKMNVMPSLQPKSDTEEEEVPEKVGKKKRKKKKKDKQPPSTVTSSSEYQDNVASDQSEQKHTEDGIVKTEPEDVTMKPKNKKKRKLSESSEQKDISEIASPSGKVKISKIETNGASADIAPVGETSKLSQNAGDKQGASAVAVDKKKKKKKKKKGANKQQQPVLSEERIKAYGFNPNKFKYTVMKKMQQGQNTDR